MKILLITPRYDSTAVPGSFPLGFGYLAAILKGRGHNVKVLDLSRTAGPESSRAATTIIQEAKEADIVGVGGMITALTSLKFITQLIKKHHPEKKVIVGGSAVSSWPEKLFPEIGADAGVLGEGEEALPELISAYENNEDITSIPGTVLKNGEEVIFGPERAVIENLDDIPFPAWDMFDIERYITTRMVVPGKKRSMNIIASRGCPFNCTFCYRNFGRKVRTRSAESVVEEIGFLVKNYNVRHIELQDELFLYSKKNVRAFCELLLRKNIKITWRALSRANILASFDADIMKLLKRCGNHWIGIGVESGSPEMLKKMNKVILPEQVIQASELCQNAGIKLSGTFLIGYPGETEETVRASVELCKKTGLYYNPFFVLPYPGTELFSRLRDRLPEDKIDDMIYKMSEDVTSLQINMTDIPDQDLLDMRERAVEEVRRNVKPASPLKRFLFQLQAYGTATILAKISKRLLAAADRIVAEAYRISGKVCLKGNPLPRAAHIEISGRCQLKCVYCSEELKKAKRAQMSIPEFRAVLDKIPSLKSVTLTIMNEPLLNSDISQIIAEAKSRGLAVDFPTNGVHFPQELQIAVLEAGLDSLSFSIDTMDPGLYSELRPPAVLEHTLANVRSFVANRDRLSSPCVISIVAIMTDKLMANIDDFAGKSLDLGVDGVILRFPHGWVSEENSVLSFDKDDVLKELEGVRKTFGGKIYYHRPSKRIAGIRCFRPFRSTAVKVDGHVVPCCLQASNPKKALLGNIYDDDFAAIWDGKAYQSFRKPFMKGRWPKICNGCTVLSGLNH